MKKTLSFVLVALSLVACTDRAKAPAEAAVQAAEVALGSLTDVAQKHLPVETAALQQSVASAKSLFEKKDYEGALAAAGDVPARTKVILATANAKEEAVGAWNAAAGPLSQMLGALKTRVESLSLLVKLPDGMQRSTFDEAKAGVTAIEAGFAEAQDQANRGEVQAATAKAGELRAKAGEIMKSLGMM